MARLVKRYGNRKLYDTNERRYVSLEDLARWIRSGEQIHVLDNKTAEDVTTQTLTQIISEQGKQGKSLIPDDLLHDLIRAGGTAMTQRIKQVQNSIDRLVRSSIDRLTPVREAREEFDLLTERLAQLEASLGRKSEPLEETDPPKDDQEDR